VMLAEAYCADYTGRIQFECDELNLSLFVWLV